MTGDAESAVEKELLKDNIDVKANILKVGHHGSKTASLEEFIHAVNPTYALISCGLNNKYNHPSQEVIKRLKNQNSIICRTDEDGDVIISITEKDIVKL